MEWPTGAKNPATPASNIQLTLRGPWAAGDPDSQRIQRVMLAAFRPEPVAEPEEVLLVDLVQHPPDRPLA